MRLSARLSQCKPAPSGLTGVIRHLGYDPIDTTLGYARLHDGTGAADYYRAMAQVEQRFASQVDTTIAAPRIGEVVAMVDALRDGTLSESQRQIVQALRAGIAAMSSQNPTEH